MKILLILKYIGLAILVGLVVFLLWWALLNGSRAAQSRQVVKDATAIVSGLDYFYKDQNRYPSIGEFNDQNVMRQYLSNFPPQDFNSGVCSGSFDYVNTFRDDYELRFCLPKGVKGYKTGWNSFKSN